ncbi:MAG: DegT/DnrJ/EryC1/StrS aminotransferase family protein [Pseudomonadota bacterium]
MIPVSKPSLGKAELAAVEKIFDSGWLGMGSATAAFEKKVEDFIGVPQVVAVNTGTSALHIALDCFDIGPGDEVIVPSMTYAACVQAIIATGARPVFCECTSASLLIDIEDVRRKITPQAKAIMPVHYCGQPCDMDALLDLAGRHDLHIIEDAAHAFGSSYKGKKIGSFGHATCFSFDPIKTITCGEGGAVALQDGRIAEKIRRKRILGIDTETWHRYRNKRNWSYAVTMGGFRYHMPNINAAIGIIQLDKIHMFIEKRRAICLDYDCHFSGLRTVAPLEVDYAATVPFMYIVKVFDGRRQEFISLLKERGVDTGIHYIPNHVHPYFSDFLRGTLPVTDEIGEQIVTLPLYYDMTTDDVRRVIDAVCEFEGVS